MRCAALVGIGSLALGFGCSARPIDDEAGVTTNASGSDTDPTTTVDEPSETETETTTTETTTETETTTTETTTTETSGDGDPSGDGDCVEPEKLDLPPDFDGVPAPDSCTIEPIEWESLAGYPGCELCQIDESWCFFYAYLGCVTPQPGQTCADLCPSGDCLGTHWSTCEGQGPDNLEPSDTCGHYEIDGQCCTIGKFIGGCAE